MQLQSERYVLHNKYVFNFNIYIFFFKQLVLFFVIFEIAYFHFGVMFIGCSWNICSAYNLKKCGGFAVFPLLKMMKKKKYYETKLLMSKTNCNLN